jgi:diaminohydroxyphosphoribosylaminopyrimidine deaminase/5-amino-6-(5-phosphoribosylamino)uracil reductase
MDVNEIYMKRCLEIAAIAEGATAPNPLVGAVIVHGDRIIGEGWHRRYGAPHAEPTAIDSVGDGEALRHSMLYVNLEPCCHYGKTPPCVEKIIAAGIPSVVIAAVDTSAKVNGKGIRALNGAGIATRVGVLEKEARELNKFFYAVHEKHRPYIFLKWAQSPDGFIDGARTSSDIPPVRISNETTRLFDHRLRSKYQAIMVGSSTVVMDNPRLTNRCWYGASPLRIVVDRRDRLDGAYSIFDDAAPTLAFTGSRRTLGAAEIVVGAEATLTDVVGALYSRRIQSLLVEGGATLLGSFIDAGLWDEAVVFTGAAALGRGAPAPRLSDADVVAREQLGTDTLTRYRHV